jgi:hypothetical protein
MRNSRYNKGMKKLLAVALVLLLGVLGLAQDTPFQPSCSETLQSNPQDFMDLYTTKNNNDSEAGQDSAALYWADCMAKRNEAQLANSGQLKARLMNLSRNYNTFFNLETELAYLAAGGGTMYPHGRARFQPSIEEHMALLIRLTASKEGATTNAAIVARYNKALVTLEVRLKKVQSKPNPYIDGYTTAEAAAKKKEWLGYAKQYALQFVNIRKNLGAKKDLVSTTILEFLARGLWTDEL